MGQATCASAASLDQKCRQALRLPCLVQISARESLKTARPARLLITESQGLACVDPFLDDGRFSMANTVAERQLHVIAIGRNCILAGFDERVLLTSSIV
jgi:hypothetical protein